MGGSVFGHDPEGDSRAHGWPGARVPATGRYVNVLPHCIVIHSNYKTRCDIEILITISFAVFFCFACFGY